VKAAIQLAGALEAAHRKSITHRDLKPAKILTAKSGVKVLGFGLAKFEVLKPKPSDETQTRALTEEGTIVGTSNTWPLSSCRASPPTPAPTSFRLAACFTKS